MGCNERWHSSTAMIYKAFKAFTASCHKKFKVRTGKGKGNLIHVLAKRSKSV